MESDSTILSSPIPIPESPLSSADEVALSRRQSEGIGSIFIRSLEVGHHGLRSATNYLSAVVMARVFPSPGKRDKFHVEDAAPTNVSPPQTWTSQKSRASTANARTETGLFKTVIGIASEAALPLRHLAARNLNDWTQDLGVVVSAAGHSVANRLAPTRTLDAEESQARRDWDSEVIVQAALTALRAEKEERQPHRVRRRRQPRIGGNPL